MSVDLQSVFAQFKKPPTTDDRAAQKAAVAEALEVAQASLADGTSVNPPEMAVALEAAVEEIAGAPEVEETEAEEVEVKPKGAGRKKAAKRVKRKPAVDTVEEAPAPEVTQTDDLPTPDAAPSTKVEVKSCKLANGQELRLGEEGELEELRQMQADALEALLHAFAQARDVGLSVELVLK